MSLPIIYVASAGTGKTTTLMNELEKALEQTDPSTVVYTTFTNAGAKEAANRAITRFSNYSDTLFKYFRTLHSIAYRAIPNRKMMNYSDYIELGSELGLFINAKRALSSSDGTVTSDFSSGDKLLHLDSLTRTRLQSFDETAANQENSFFAADEIEDFSTKYRNFRNKNSLYDFTDQLEKFLDLLRTGSWCPRITHLFIDEAQDLSPLQWAILDELANLADQTYIAGDDKQAIYGFSGGDPNQLIKKEGRRIILETSYRLPKKVLEFSEKIAERIQEKQDYVCISDIEGGHWEYIWTLDDLDLENGEWMLLARNRKFMSHFEDFLINKGIPFLSDSGASPITRELCDAVKSWELLIKGYSVSGAQAKSIYTNYLRGVETVARGGKKAIQYLDDDETVTLADLEFDYGLKTKMPWEIAFSLPEVTKTALKAMEKLYGLDKEPTIRISTIHGVKGQECENVVILPDMAYMTNESYLKNPDDEHRVFYVAATRAKKNLFIHQPITDMFYPL